MGSEVSSDSNKPFEMELAGGVMKSPCSKPARHSLCAEDFYCPLVYCNEEEKARQKPIIDADATPSSLLKESDYFKLVVQINDDLKEAELTDKNRPELDNLRCDHSESKIHMDTLEEQIASTIVESESNQIFKEDFGHPDLIQNPIFPNCVEIKDTSANANTSLPTFDDAATGSSQPYLMMDCATGMSQPLGATVITVDCCTQTSQEFPFTDQAILQNNETKSGNPQKSTSTLNNKPLIVFPRVSCQTTAPEIPAKIPRLDDLDRDIVMNPIYSSEVTFDFSEADKENNSSVLRQRGNMGKRMRETSSSGLKYYHNKPSENENLPNDKLTPSYPTSSNVLIASRGPFLRLGLSKKSRTRNPLHPRNFEPEQNSTD